MFSWRICLCRFVSFRFKAKESLQRCGDIFFDILSTNMGRRNQSFSQSLSHSSLSLTSKFLFRADWEFFVMRSISVKTKFDLLEFYSFHSPPVFLEDRMINCRVLLSQPRNHWTLNCSVSINLFFVTPLSVLSEHKPKASGPFARFWQPKY